MLALQKTSPRPGLELNQVPEPAPAAGEALIEVGATGVCGTDLHIDDWTAGYDWLTPLLPVTLGHEFAGTVVALGAGVDTLHVGARVTVNPGIACLACAACRQGCRGQCTQRSGIGGSSRGAFSTRVSVPAENCHILPDNVSLEVGALVEPLCVGARAVEVGEVAPGDQVVVLGAGMIGMAIALMAQHRGASVAIFGLNDGERLHCARALGLADAVDLAEEPLGDAVMRIFGDKVDRVFEASGAPESVTEGLQILRPGGVLVSSGIHPRPLQLDLTQLGRMKHQIRGSHAWIDEDWNSVLSFISERPIDLSGAITHRFPLSEAHAAFEAARNKSGLKVMVVAEPAE